MSQEPDWESIKTFAAVAQSGTVRGAARLLGVHHSTISRRVEALEQSLGSLLFERQPEGLLLTAAGEQLAQVATRFSDALLATTRSIAGQDDALSGVLTVTCTEAIADLVLGPRLQDFIRRHPQLELCLVTTNDKLDVSRREADVAIRADNNPPGTLVGKRLFRYFQSVYASPRYVAQVDPLGHPERARWLGWNERGQRFPSWTQDTPFAVAPVWGEFPDVHLQRIAARNGLGLAMLPCLLGDADPDLVRVGDMPPVPSRTLWLLTHADLRNTARVRAFMQFAERALRDMRAAIEGRDGAR